MLLGEIKHSFYALEGTFQEILLNPFQTVGVSGSKIQKPLGKALRITKREDAPIKVFLGGHMDTVFPLSSPFQNATFIDDAVLKGPGTADMKGGLVIMLYALHALEKSPYAKNIGWEVLINPDEEISSFGSRPFLQKSALKNHIGLIFEPSFPDGAIVSQRAGSMNLIIGVHGRSAHAGRDFSHGKNAAFAAAHLLHDIDLLNDPQATEEDLVTINVGNIQSGHTFNIVPEVATLKINIRSFNKNRLDHTYKMIKELIYKHEQKLGIRIELYEQSINEPKEQSKKIESLLQSMKECALLLDIPLEWRRTRGVSDGNYLSYHGLCCLDSLGAVGNNIHTDEEHIILKSLLERSKMTALFLMKLGNGEYNHFKGTLL